MLFNNSKTDLDTASKFINAYDRSENPNYLHLKVRFERFFLTMNIIIQGSHRPKDN